MPAAASRLIISFDMTVSSWSVSVARIRVAIDVVLEVAIAVRERIDLLFGLVLRDAIRFLQLACELIALAGDRVDLVVGQLAPLFLDLARQLLPVAFNPIPVHCSAPHHGPPWSSRTPDKCNRRATSKDPLIQWLESQFT